MTLHELGLKYGTDKTSHGFCSLYDSYLKDYTDKFTKVLEIGIYCSGASIRMWRDYFPNAMIYGADLSYYADNYFESDRIKTFCINQELESDLLSLPDDLDLFIDDGGHTMLQQQITLKVMIDKVKSGGFFILEDLHTSLSSWDWNNYGRTDTNNTIKLLSDLKSGIKSQDSTYFISDDDFKNILSKINFIELYECSPGSLTSIIIKK